MSDASSAEPPPAPATTSPPWPMRTRAALLAWNFMPLGHVAAMGAASMLVPGWWKALVVVVLLYGLPPLMARTLLAWRPIVAGTHPVGSSSFVSWWATAQCQMLFCRLPALEEVLRLVPGLYSAWLRLWGARIGRLTFWSPGLRILDRSFLVIGDDVVFGAGVRLNPHVISGEAGRLELHLAPIDIGSGARIGGYALLTAGTVVGAGEQVHAFALCPPFTRWREGRRLRPAHPR